ncbi:MAG: branched-chain amino acid ABC transporter ATP-binding protein/permease [Candidatus Dormiibacterota bacterium]
MAEVAREVAIAKPKGDKPPRRTIGAILTPRRSNVILLLLFFALVPTLTSRTMPLWFKPSMQLVLGEAVAFAIAALALNLLIGYAGQISLGHAALLGFGAFISGLLTGQMGLSMAISIPVAAIVSASVAFVIGVPSLRLKGLYLAMATIAFGFAFEQSVFRMDIFSGSAGLELPRRVFGETMLDNNADLLAVALVLLLVVWLLDTNVVRSKVGRAFKAIREDESVAQSFGINVTGYKLLAFALSGALAGVAGAIYGHFVGFANNESFPFALSLQLIIMVVVGGLGSRVGVVLSAIFFTLFPEVLSGFSGWQIVAGSALLMYTVARHPGGLAQMAAEIREARAKRKAPPEDDSIEEAGNLPKLPDMPRPTGLPARQQSPEMSMPGAEVLRVDDVTVRFGGLVAVDSASLSVPRGQIVGLIGPNGAGKSTLFNAISGLVVPESGRIHLLGEDVTKVPPHLRARRGIGRTFQNIGLAKDLSVLDNFLLAQHVIAGYGAGGGLLNSPRAARVERELRDRAHTAIKALDFERFTDQPLKNLSHGQQRIVELGCALVTAPELLMLDEPSAGMSPGAAENLAVRLRDLRDELGHTVLVIEHNVPMVLDVCDYIYVLSYGQILAHGTTEQIAAHPEVIGAYFGEAAA